jgi:hypothetical protein
MDPETQMPLKSSRQIDIFIDWSEFFHLEFRTNMINIQQALSSNNFSFGDLIHRLFNSLII